MLRASTVILAAVVAALIAAPLSAADGVVLRFKGKEGEKQYYQMSSRISMTQKINGMDLGTKMDFKQSLVREFKKPDEKKNLSLETRSLRMQMDAEFPGLGEYKYDSDSTDNDTSSAIGSALAPLYDAMNGALVEVTVSPLGHVTKAKGFAEAVQGAIGNNPIAQQFGAAGSNEKAAAMSFQEQFVRLSKEAVSEGDEWETPFEMEFPKLGTAKGVTKMKYEGTEDVDGKELHKISISSSMDFDLDLDVGGAKGSGKMKITASKGIALFDAENGRLVSKKLEQTVGGDITVEAGGNVITITQEQDQNVEFKLLDGPPKKDK